MWRSKPTLRRLGPLCLLRGFLQLLRPMELHLNPRSPFGRLCAILLPRQKPPRCSPTFCGYLLNPFVVPIRKVSTKAAYVFNCVSVSGDRRVCLCRRAVEQRCVDHVSQPTPPAEVWHESLMELILSVISQLQAPPHHHDTLSSAPCLASNQCKVAHVEKSCRVTCDLLPPSYKPPSGMQASVSAHLCAPIPSLQFS